MRCFGEMAGNIPINATFVFIDYELAFISTLSAPPPLGLSSRLLASGKTMPNEAQNHIHSGQTQLFYLK